MYTNKIFQQCLISRQEFYDNNYENLKKDFEDKVLAQDRFLKKLIKRSKNKNIVLLNSLSQEDIHNSYLADKVLSHIASEALVYQLNDVETNQTVLCCKTFNTIMSNFNIFKGENKRSQIKSDAFFTMLINSYIKNQHFIKFYGIKKGGPTYVKNENGIYKIGITGHNFNSALYGNNFGNRSSLTIKQQHYTYYEYLDGISLKQYLYSQIDLVEFINIWYQICKVLEELQNNYSYTHYNLHSENIILQKQDNQYVVRIIDNSSCHIKINDYYYYYNYTGWNNVFHPFHDIYLLLITCAVNFYDARQYNSKYNDLSFHIDSNTKIMNMLRHFIKFFNPEDSFETISIIQNKKYQCLLEASKIKETMSDFINYCDKYYKNSYTEIILNNKKIRLTYNKKLLQYYFYRIQNMHIDITTQIYGGDNNSICEMYNMYYHLNHNNYLDATFAYNFTYFLKSTLENIYYHKTKQIYSLLTAVKKYKVIFEDLISQKVFSEITEDNQFFISSLIANIQYLKLDETLVEYILQQMEIYYNFAKYDEKDLKSLIDILNILVKYLKSSKNNFYQHYDLINFYDFYCLN